MADLLDPNRINTEDYLSKLAQMFTYMQVLKGMGVPDTLPDAKDKGTKRMFDWGQASRWVIPDNDTQAAIRYAPGSQWPSNREIELFGIPHPNSPRDFSVPSFIPPGVIPKAKGRGNYI